MVNGSVEDLSVCWWFIGGPVGGSVLIWSVDWWRTCRRVGGRWPFGGHWFCNTPYNTDDCFIEITISAIICLLL